MDQGRKQKSFKKGYYRTHACREAFICEACGRLVVPEGAGSGHRNHCPNCLTSLHVDEEPGDRMSDCGGQMEPIGVWVRKGGEWALIHRCEGIRFPGCPLFMSRGAKRPPLACGPVLCYS